MHPENPTYDPRCVYRSIIYELARSQIEVECSGRPMLLRMEAPWSTPEELVLLSYDLKPPSRKYSGDFVDEEVFNSVLAAIMGERYTEEIQKTSDLARDIEFGIASDAWLLYRERCWSMKPVIETLERVIR